jgi:hypothetical protein
MEKQQDREALHTIEVAASAYTREGALIVRDELARLFADLHQRGITHRGFSVGTGYRESASLRRL